MERGSTVLFAFDDHHIPFKSGGITTELVSYRVRCGTTNRVVTTGPPGSVDSQAVVYYGTTVWMSDAICGPESWSAELRQGWNGAHEGLVMYYIGLSDADDTWHGRLCVALSAEGRVWSKPSLSQLSCPTAELSNHPSGILSNNALVIAGDEDSPIFAVLVIDDAPRRHLPSQRLKMLYKAKPGGVTEVRKAYSADGLKWVAAGGTGLSVEISGIR